MSYRRVSHDPGTDLSRPLPCNVIYEDEHGNRAHLEVSLNILPSLPESCDRLPCGPDVNVREWEMKDPPL